MTAQEISELIGKDGFDKVLEHLKSQNKIETDIVKTNNDEYSGDHEILKREDKIIGKGNEKKTVKTAKLITKYQKKIIRSTVAFLFGEPVTLVVKDEQEDTSVFDTLMEIWDNNKLDYFNKKICRKTSIDTRAAELWYIVKDEDIDSTDSTDNQAMQIKVMLLAESKGDGLFPYYDKFGDMVIFTRYWKRADAEKNTETEYVTIYHAKKIWNATRTKDGDWEFKVDTNELGKIPIIYYQKDESEWSNVKTLIDRIEMLISKHADANDYFASPAVKAKGKIVNPPDKDEVGKFFQIEMEESTDGRPIYGDIEYLTWDQTPKSIELEYGQLEGLIYSMTSTPEITFSNIKGTGNISGIAMRFMFMDALMKAKDQEELYGENITRRINLLKKMMSVIDQGKSGSIKELKIEVKFNTPLPKDLMEKLDALSLARNSGVLMSQETAVGQNPMVEDTKDEIDKLNEERTRENEQTRSLGESFDV